MGLGIHLVPISTSLCKMRIYVEECKLSLPIREGNVVLCMTGNN